MNAHTMSDQALLVKILTDEAQFRGIELQPVSDDGLLVRYDNGQLPGDYAALLKANKPQILAWIKAQHTVGRILATEFAGCDGAMAENLIHDLKVAEHPFLERAVEILFAA